MFLKEYQLRTLDVVRTLLEEFAAQRREDAEARAHNPQWGFEWVRRAWGKVAGEHTYKARRNGLGEELPAFCLKIPTGGGKTLLATKVIDLVNVIFRQDSRGLVLWVVPTAQIYNQTLKALKDRNHPYRQQLDLSSGQRTRIFEKHNPFRPSDVAENLCILLLMLPSANRQTKDTLRMFRDSAGYEQFFPADDDHKGHAKLLELNPNLDTFGQSVGMWGRYAKTSLGNTVRVLRPLIILDEGHKAYSANAKSTLEGFNPCMIVELSATPAKDSNVLVEILGSELNLEEMVKLDLHIKNRAEGDWRDTLLASIEHRKWLEAQAATYKAATGIYIRPICVIQVERTGKEQRRPGIVHTDDVRDYLLRYPGVRQEHIAIKTSSKDELRDVDDVGGLMSRECPIRYIITKQALQEGWDCSFAYVLSILANPSSRTGLTQLVGRILRQPYAHKTGVAPLDESYVFCYSRRGADILKDVRRGFGMEGLQGLEGRVVEDNLAGGGAIEGHTHNTIATRQRAKFRASAQQMVLPAFMIYHIDRWRLVYFETDILSRLPWEQIDLSPLSSLKLNEGRAGGEYIRAGIDGLRREIDSPYKYAESLLANEDSLSSKPAVPMDSLDYYFAASHLLDLVPNPWRGREFVSRTIEGLLGRYSVEQVAANKTLILGTLRKQIEKERDRLSQEVFEGLLASGEMRFLVVTHDLSFNRLPKEIQAPKAKQANRDDGAAFQRNLFDITTEDNFNQLENAVATYLDTQARLFFWYRNRARKDYYVQAWKPRKIYADFIVTLRNGESVPDDDFHQVFVLETKGMHLEGSEDTNYKRSVFDICNEHAHKAKWAEFVPAMQDKRLRFEVVDEKEWEARLNDLLLASQN